METLENMCTDVDVGGRRECVPETNRFFIIYTQGFKIVGKRREGAVCWHMKIFLRHVFVW